MDPKPCILAALCNRRLYWLCLSRDNPREMGNVDYRPAAISAHVGDTIEWTNTDFLAHTATARDKNGM
jgi:hypothetical protein